MESEKTKSADQSNSRSNSQPNSKESAPEKPLNNRNVATSQPVDDNELAENLQGADSSLEKPKNQDK